MVPKKVVIGAQSFTEQSVLVQMVRQFIEDRTSLRTIVLECGDAYGCTQALYLKHIDLMIGYSGTGLMYSPSRTIRHRGTLKEVRNLYAKSDISWLQPLGYESGYAIVLPKSKAKEFAISTIADLRNIKGGVRVTCSNTYLGRIGDGLSSLIRRHGLELRGEPLLIDDPVVRIRELFRRGADVAIVRQLELPEDPGLQTLRDSLHFFPIYEAAIVARKQTLQSRPDLKKFVYELSNQIRPKDMRQLVSEVQDNGWSPSGVARRFLQHKELLLHTSKRVLRRPLISIAVDPQIKDQYPDLTVLAVRATRHAFPKYAVRLLSTSDPVATIVQGNARLGILGAESFFNLDDGTSFANRKSQIEAATVLGSSYLHLLRRHSDSEEEPFSGRIGISAFLPDRPISFAILDAAGIEPTMIDDPEQLLGKIVSEELDGMMVFRLPGDSQIRHWMKQHKLELRELPEISGNLPPFLQPAYIPPGTYPQQPRAVATDAVQILIAGRAPLQRSSPLAGSPAVAMISQSHPLSLRETRAMQETIAAVKPVETPHPVLPSVWLRTVVEGGKQNGPTTVQTLLDTSLNILVILFLGWVAVLVIRRPKREKAD